MSRDMLHCSQICAEALSHLGLLMRSIFKHTRNFGSMELRRDRELPTIVLLSDLLDTHPNRKMPIGILKPLES
eukprot:7803653-Pyramimonas_sp.AAC.1